MFEQLSTVNKVMLGAWAVMLVVFVPRLIRDWQGRRQDWLEVAWIAATTLIVTIPLVRPDLQYTATLLVFWPLMVLSLLERRSRKE